MGDPILPGRDTELSRIVAFKADDAEEAEIVTYCKERHFKNVADFARFAIFAYIRQNKPGKP